MTSVGNAFVLVCLLGDWLYIAGYGRALQFPLNGISSPECSTLGFSH